MTLKRRCLIVGWCHGPQGWIVSKAARDSLKLYGAILHIAQTELGISGCVGARFGHGMAVANAMELTAYSMILYWLDNEANIDAKIVSIPDIEDPPNWVSHAERYHGESGVFFSSDLTSSELYESSKWPVISMPLVERERFEGWRVRETARMLSTINDDNAIKMILGQSVPETIIDFLISNDCLKRLAFLGEGGEPVG